MPGYDGTGPAGQGPAGGWGSGYCPGNRGNPPGRGFSPVAGKRRFARPLTGPGPWHHQGPGPSPWGRRGCGFWGDPYPYRGRGYAPETQDEAQELKLLEEETGYLEVALGSLRKRMEEIKGSLAQDSS